MIEYKNLQNSVNEYQVSLRKMQTEFERLQTIIDKLKKEREVSHAKVFKLLIVESFVDDGSWKAEKD